MRKLILTFVFFLSSLAVFASANEMLEDLLCVDYAIMVQADFFTPDTHFRTSVVTEQQFNELVSEYGVHNTYSMLEYCITGTRLDSVSEFYFDTRIIVDSSTPKSSSSPDTLYFDRYGTALYQGSYFNVPLHQLNQLRSGLFETSERNARPLYSSQDTVFLMETRHFGSGRYSELVLVYPISNDSLRVEAIVDDGRLVENVVSCSYGEKVIREFMRIVDTRDTTAPNTFRVRSRMDGVSYSYVTSDSGNHCHMSVRAHYSLVSRLIHGLYER